jgi:hypothetical protein
VHHDALHAYFSKKAICPWNLSESAAICMQRDHHVNSGICVGTKNSAEQKERNRYWNWAYLRDSFRLVLLFLSQPLSVQKKHSAG